MSGGDQAAKDFIEKEVSEHKIVVFSKTYCGYCQRTKMAIKQFDGDVAVHELDTMDDGSTIQRVLLTMTGSRTVPQVFVDGKYVGGNDVTQARIADGTFLS